MEIDRPARRACSRHRGRWCLSANAECNAGRLIEVDPQGNIVKQIKLLPDGQDDSHGFIRNARQLENGNYLVAHFVQGMVREYDRRGDVVAEFPAPGGPHSVVRLPNGNTLIACGDQTKHASVLGGRRPRQYNLASYERGPTGDRIGLYVWTSAPSQRQHGHDQLARPWSSGYCSACHRSFAKEGGCVDIRRSLSHKNDLDDSALRRARRCTPKERFCTKDLPDENELRYSTMDCRSKPLPASYLNSDNHRGVGTGVSCFIRW